MFGSSSKTAKCKTQLKMVVSRIKILRNKREIQVKHLRRDVAQLLKNKQDANARTRVEHAIREQNMVDAYSLIEGYCNFLDSRIQSLSGQKECPAELKEAVASLIYAGPRCADLPELLEIRSIFTSKFGKSFIATIVELRVGCGVSRMITEKLSSQPIPTEAKVRFMHEVAKEHNVKWQPEDLSAGEIKQAPTTTAPTAKTPPPAAAPIIVKTIREDRNSSPKSPLASSVRSSAQAISEPDSEDEEVTPKPPPPPPQLRSKQESQYIPFVPSEDPYAQYNKGPVNPYAQQAPPPADPYAEYQKKFMGNNANAYHDVAAAASNNVNAYHDVAAAAEAAAESADQAAAAARAAANLAHRHLSRENSMASSSPTEEAPKPARKVSVASLEDRVSSYLMQSNDTDSEWDSPGPREEPEQVLNPGRNLSEEQRRRSTGASRSTGYSVDQRLSLGAARGRQGVDPGLFRSEKARSEETEVFFQRQQYEYDKPVFDEAPVAVSRVDSFSVHLESMSDKLLARTERLFEKEDSDHLPAKSVEKMPVFDEAEEVSGYSFSGGGKDDEDDSDDDSRLVSRSDRTRFGKQEEEARARFSTVEVKVSSTGGRGGKMAEQREMSRSGQPPSRLPPEVPGDSTQDTKHLNFRRQFRGAGVDYSETSSLAKKPNRFAGASVRTKRS